MAEELLLDSSVAVALLMEDYMAGHALFETMSVLTRLSGADRRAVRIVGTAIARSFPATRFLAEAGSSSLMTELAEAGISGGAIFDALVAAANGAVAHVGLTVEAPQLQAWGKKFQAAYNTSSDHNGVKGYTGVYVLKAAIEKAGKVDRKAAAAAIRNSCFTAKQYPGVLMDVCFDDKGDIDRESFITEIRNGKTVVAETLPPMNKK